MRRADDLVAIDLADKTGLLDERHLAARQADILLQADLGQRVGKEIVNAVFESNADKRQSVERSRADILHTRGDIEPYFHGDGVVPLHLLGGEARGLGGDFKDDRRGIRIGLDIKAGKGNETAGDEDEQAQQHDRASGQAKCDNAPQHGSPRYHSWKAHRALAVASILLRKIAPSVATSSPGRTPSRICRYSSRRPPICAFRRVKRRRSAVTQIVWLPSPSRTTPSRGTAGERTGAPT